MKNDECTDIYKQKWIYVPFNDSYELAYLTGNTYKIFMFANNEIEGLDEELANYICTLHNERQEKDQWIQEVKALLFDFTYSSAEASLKKEAKELLIEGGGYDPMEESSETELRWRKQDD